MPNLPYYSGTCSCHGERPVSCRNRADVESRFAIEAGRIIHDSRSDSYSTYVGQPSYVPYFWHKHLEGWADDYDGDDPVFVVLPEDLHEFPELTGISSLRLHHTLDDEVHEIWRVWLSEISDRNGNIKTFEPPVVPFGLPMSESSLGNADGYRGVPPAKLTPEYLRGYADGAERRLAGG